MAVGFKEWAIIVEALGRGEQVLILRKGGIAEAGGEFALGHREFVLFPTTFHQQGDRVKPALRSRLPEVLSRQHPGFVRLEYLAQVVRHDRLTSRAELERLDADHGWLPQVVQERFQEGGWVGIHQLVVRVYRLAAPVELRWQPDWGGCRSWVDLPLEVSGRGLEPVLDDQQFSRRLSDLGLSPDHGCLPR